MTKRRVLQISIAAIAVSLLVMYLVPFGYATHPLVSVKAKAVVTLSAMNGVAVGDVINVQLDAVKNVLKIEVNQSTMAEIAVTDISETSDSIFVQGTVVESDIAGLAVGTTATCGYHLDAVACSGESPSNVTALIAKLEIKRIT